MDRMKQRKEQARHEQRQTKILLTVAAVLLFCGLFAQIAVRAQVSAQAKEIAAVQAQLRTMQSEADNLNLCINQHHNLEDIGMRAQALGLVQPTEDQLRVVNLPQIGDTSTQTVANISGEEING